MKKVLIIGGTGTISTPIVRQLALDEQVELYVMNRGKHNGSLPEDVHYLQADASNSHQVLNAIGAMTFDSVIHFVIMDPESAKFNVELFRGRTKQFIFISTVVVLDHQRSCNVNEESLRGNRISIYGKNKSLCEEVFQKAYNDIGFPVTIVRPTQTYSENRIPLSVKGKNCWSVVSRMLRGKEVIVHGDGQSVWASTHADDFARAFLPLICNSDTIGEIYQIMNNASHTWDMVYQTLADLLNVEYHPVYISSYLLEHSKVYGLRESILGDKHFSNIFSLQKIHTIVPDFTCQIDLKTGLEKYLSYMEAHPEEKIPDDAFDLWCDETIRAYRRAESMFLEEMK